MTYHVVSREKDVPYFRLFMTLKFESVVEARKKRDEMQARFPSLVYSVRNDANNSCDLYPLSDAAPMAKLDKVSAALLYSGARHLRSSWAEVLNYVEEDLTMEQYQVAKALLDEGTLFEAVMVAKDG